MLNLLNEFKTYMYIYILYIYIYIIKFKRIYTLINQKTQRILAIEIFVEEIQFFVYSYIHL